jgi:hypothetical protein
MIVTAAVVALVAVVYFSSVSGRHIHRFMSDDTMAERISTDLPQGSSVQQVDKYLSDNGVVHSLAWDGKMYGVINWMWGSCIVERSAQIIITFQNGKVEHIEVNSFGTFF